MSRENDDSAKDETGLDAPLECVVCLMTFDLDDHLPKSLRCGHTVCQLCMTKLTKHATVSCPTCRHDSSLHSDVKTNYALKDILEKLCPECKQQKPCGQCRHCDLRVCTDCRHAHVQTYASDASAQIHTLQDVVKLAQDASLNTNFEDDQHREKERAMAEVQRALDDIERRNLDRLHNWSSELMDQSSAALTFIRASKAQLRKDVNEFPVVKEVTDECEALLGELKKLMRGPPHLAEYSVQVGTDQDASQTSALMNQPPSAGQSATSKPAAGPHTSKKADVSHPTRPQLPPQVPPRVRPKVPTSGSTSEPAPEPTPGLTQGLARNDVNAAQDSSGAVAIAELPTPIPVRSSSIYKQMRFQRMTRNKPSSFKDPVSVICVNKTIFVTDWGNDQIKQLDFDLNLLATIGGPQRFNHPSGIAHNGTGLFITGQFNNKVKLINFNGDTVGKFGASLNAPKGIASALNGDLFICDSLNFRVRVVKADGTHIRDIGSKGPGRAQFESEPTRIAITKANTLLVKKWRRSKLSHFSMSGEFLGLWPPKDPDTFKDVVISTVAVDPVDGHVLIAYKNDMVGVYTAEGAFVCAMGSHGIGPAQFNNVTGLAVSENRDLFVCDSDNHRIQKWGVDPSSSPAQ